MHTTGRTEQPPNHTRKGGFKPRTPPPGPKTLRVPAGVLRRVSGGRSIQVRPKSVATAIPLQQIEQEPRAFKCVRKARASVDAPFPASYLGDSTFDTAKRRASDYAAKHTTEPSTLLGVQARASVDAPFPASLPWGQQQTVRLKQTHHSQEDVGPTPSLNQRKHQEAEPVLRETLAIQQRSR